MSQKIIRMKNKNKNKNANNPLMILLTNNNNNSINNIISINEVTISEIHTL